ncbi:MAG: transcription termination/antitermination protein NusA [Bdellovibrionales bacterium]|nr:transcription termination/antitermination protein NusA [Bdellovibrionales bacterium]
MASELVRVIEQVEKEKGIEKAVLIEALESAMLMAAKKRFGLEREIEAQFNDELGEVELFEFKTVSERVQDTRTEISLKEAQKLDPEVVLGDSIGVKLDNSEFGRIAAQTAKQVIIQKVRDAERDIIYNEFNVRKGELVSGVCRRIEKGCLIIDLGRTDAILPGREQIPGEHYRPGDRVMGYLIDVQQTPRGPKIVLSRTCPELLIQLFHQEVPEVAEGIVQIKSAAREPGVRAKIAVDSRDPDVDPVGACVGVKGVRVQNVVQELRGEKIDIVPWDEEDSRFVCNALAPAEVQKVLLDEENRSMEIVVADNQLSLAIGKRGQNVKLASMLTGWKIDIVSESKMTGRLEAARTLLQRIPDVDETMAKTLYHFGFEVEVLASSEPAALKAIPGMADEKAQALVEGAKVVVAAPNFAEEKAELLEKLTPVVDSRKAGAPLPSSKKLSADEVFAKLKAEVRAQETKDAGEPEAMNEAGEQAPLAQPTEGAAEAKTEEETKDN